MPGNNKKLILQKDWDIPLRLNVSKKEAIGHFAGRKKEVALLENEIIRKDSGSILVCGHRGVGKTSLVYQAIKKFKEETPGIPETVVVGINFPQLEIKNINKNENEKEIEYENYDEQKKVLVALIKRLYHTCKIENITLDSNIENEIFDIYEKALASKYKHHKYDNQGNNTSKASEKKSSLYIKVTSLVYLLICILAIVNIFFSFTQLYITNIIHLLLLFSLPFAFMWIYEKKYLQTEKESSEKNEKKTHEFDYRIGDLEYDLEFLYRKMADDKIKVIYVIDELDKLKPAIVNGLLGKFKNLFTLSEALFIFICGQETYDFINKKNKNEYRPTEYTYFTSKYYLSRPLMSDLIDYLDKITYNSGQIREKELMIFKKALIFEAQSDFFDLKACIQNRVTSFDEKKRPIIELNDTTNEDIQKGRFQTLISILFEEKYMSLNPLKWSENEELQREIYKHAHRIYESLPQTEFVDPEDNLLKSKLIRDFNSFLARCGAFKASQSNNKNVYGSGVNVEKYIYEGSIPKEPPSSLSSFTEYEQKFMKLFKRYCEYFISILNSFEVMSDNEEVDLETFFKEPRNIIRKLRKYGISEFNGFDEHFKVFEEGIKNDSIMTQDREKIEKMTINVKNAIDVLFAKIPNALVYKINDEYKEYGLNNSNHVSKYLAYLYKNFGKDSKYNSKIQQLNTFSFIAFPKDKEIFIGIDKKSLLKNLISRKDDGNHESEILIIEINTDNEIPIEVSNNIETDSPRNLKETLIDFLESIKEYVNSLQKAEN